MGRLFVNFGVLGHKKRPINLPAISETIKFRFYFKPRPQLPHMPSSGTMTNPQAAYTLMMMLSVIDGQISPEEQEVIQNYVQQEFGTDLPFDSLNQELLQLEPDDLLERFQQAAMVFYDGSQPEDRRRLLDHSLQLVMADGQLSEEELNIYQGLASIWGINVDELINTHSTQN